MSVMRSALLWASRQRWLGEQFRRRSFARRAVRRFMPGEDVDAALTAAGDLARQRIGTVLTQLGENITELGEARAVTAHYLDVLDRIAQRGDPTQISVKPTQLGLDLDKEYTYQSLVSLVDRAAAAGNFVWIDMESSLYVDPTLELVHRVRAGHPNIGVCLQSYLRRTAADLAPLIGAGTGIRLVKGAYAEPASIAFPTRREVDESYIALADQLLRAKLPPGVRTAFGTHDLEIIERIRTSARGIPASRDSFEFHLLYGIKRDHQLRLAEAGEHVRVLISYGAHWFPWYMRRLAERPANVWFVLRNVVGG